MAIDRALLEQRLDELYAIGAQPDGGVYRPLYGAAWASAVDRVEQWFKVAGLAPRRDAVGNLWGLVEGRDKGKRIVTGSHIDTVRHGGRLDGALGIVAGLTAVESLLKEKGQPRRTVEVVAICEEEGSAFATNFWGSRAIIGAIDRVDPPMADAMRDQGLDAGRVAAAARDDIDTFLELHIEQGAVLEGSGTPIAIVSAIAGAAQLEIGVTGRPDHAGTTPMDLRTDALVGASVMIQGIESVARSSGHPAVATVGQIRVAPDQINVIPGRAAFTVDVRHADLGALRSLQDRIRSLCTTVAAERGLVLEIRLRQEKPPVLMHPDVRALLWKAVRDAGVNAVEMVSGAGHDAQILAARANVGMLFVPSIGGRSHCPEEATKPEHLELGTTVLRQALQIIAY
jgi:allantoate deiminase